ncbi:MAG: bestrophin-like domain [Pseudomonadota bacterium]
MNLPLWLASEPLWQSASITIGALVLLATLGHVIVHQFWTEAELLGNNQVGGFKYEVIGEIYSVILVLALIGTWDIYTTARNNVQREAATLSMLKEAAAVYSEPSQVEAQAEMRQHIRLYARAVVDKEWKILERGQASPEAAVELSNLAAAFLRVDPVNARQQALQQNTAQWLATINEIRSFRLTTISRSLTGLVWGLMLAGTVVVILFPWYFSTPNVIGQTSMSAVLAGVLGAVLLVIVRLAHPFSGETAISAEALVLLAQ